jgi:hypothetical protein
MSPASRRAIQELAAWELSPTEFRSDNGTAAIWVTIIMHGQSARPRCSDRAAQISAFANQRNRLVRPLHARGLGVRVLVATNDCPDDPALNHPKWRDTVVAGYRSGLANVTFDSCAKDPSRRCLLRRALELWDAVAARYPAEVATGVVLLTRPDLDWLVQGPELALALVGIALRQGKMAWPYRCEAAAFDGWGCVVDTAVALPARLLAPYRQECLGRVSCHPEAGAAPPQVSPTAAAGNSGGDGGSGAAPPRIFAPYNHGYDVANGYSGHGCARCVGLAAATRGSGLEGVGVAFAWEEARLDGNTRRAAGRNPFYAILGRHDSAMNEVSQDAARGLPALAVPWRP